MKSSTNFFNFMTFHVQLVLFYLYLELIFRNFFKKYKYDPKQMSLFIKQLIRIHQYKQNNENNALKSPN